MASEENHMTSTKDDSGYGAAQDGDREDMPDQAQPERRQPPSDEETEQDNYANTDEEGS
jgi:hypothetical protein